MILINSTTEIRTWLGNSFGGPRYEPYFDGVTEMIRAGDHPAWGDDWEYFLEKQDWDVMFRKVENAENNVT